MLTVRDLAEKFDLSERSVSRRLAALGLDKDGDKTQYIERGKGDKYLITENGISIFNRLIELEHDGYTIGDAAKKVRDEIGKRAEPGSNGQEEVNTSIATQELTRNELITSLKEQIELLKTQIERKDDQIKVKDRQIERLQDILNNRLPGNSQDVEDENELEYLQSIIAKQREEIETLKLERPSFWERFTSWLSPKNTKQQEEP